MMISSFSRSRDRRGQRLRRRWTSWPKPVTRAPPPTPLVDLALPLRITRLPPSPSSVLSAKQNEVPTPQLKSPLLRALRASSRQPALKFPEAAAVAAAAAVPRILLSPLPAALSVSLVLLRGAVTGVGVTLPVAVPRIPPPPSAASSPSLGPTVAAAVQMSAVSPAVLLLPLLLQL